MHFSQSFLGLGLGTSQVPKLGYNSNQIQFPTLCYECSSLASVMGMVPDFCDIIRMTVSPHRASFQGTYCVARSLIPLGRWEHMPNTMLTSIQHNGCSAQAHWGDSSLQMHIQDFLTQFPSHSATHKPPDQPNRVIELANLSYILKDTLFYYLLSKMHYWIPEFELRFSTAISKTCRNQTSSIYKTIHKPLVFICLHCNQTSAKMC